MTRDASVDELQADLELMLRTGKEAAQLSLGFLRNELKAHKKADGTVVTNADLAVNALLAERLRSQRPDYGWLSEESADDKTRLEAKRVFIVDPIDGTRAFLRGDDDWTIVLSIVERNNPIVSVIVNPSRKEIYHAINQGGAFLNGTPIRTKDKSTLENAKILASDGVLHKAIWQKRPWPGLTRVKPLALAYRLASVAHGRIDGAFALKPRWEWDIAAGALIVSEAGGVITSVYQDPLVFNSADAKVEGFVAAAPNLHQMMMRHIESAESHITS